MKKPRVDRRRMEAAVKEFLLGAGMDLRDPNLRETHKRVAEAWIEEFIDGYAKTPSEVLGEKYPAPKGAKGELVIVTNLRFHSMCPHHLLPWEGVAHVAYEPGKYVIGFGRLSALLDTFAHRLLLQEDLARVVAKSLKDELKSPATACILEAKQSCLRLRGDKQRDALTHAEAYEGKLRTNKALRAELWARIGPLHAT
ncbi:MAG: GTP cyclohydrolase I [Myxococcaceae bacterium]